MSVQFTPILPLNLAAAHGSAQGPSIALPLPLLPPPVGLSVPEDDPTLGTQTQPSFSSQQPIASRCHIASISLTPPIWSTANYDRFPSAHRAAVRTLLLIHAKNDSLLSTLPKDVLLHELLPQLGYSSFATVQVALAAEPLEHLSGEMGQGKARRKRRGKAQPMASWEQAEERESSHVEDSDNESERSQTSEGSESETERSRSSRSSSEEAAEGEGGEEEVISAISVYRHNAIASQARRGWNRLLRCF